MGNQYQQQQLRGSTRCGKLLLVPSPQPTNHECKSRSFVRVIYILKANLAPRNASTNGGRHPQRCRTKQYRVASSKGSFLKACSCNLTSMQPSEGADVESEYDDEAMEVDDEQGRDDAEPVSP